MSIQMRKVRAELLQDCSHIPRPICVQHQEKSELSPIIPYKVIFGWMREVKKRTGEWLGTIGDRPNKMVLYLHYPVKDTSSLCPAFTAVKTKTLRLSRPVILQSDFSYSLRFMKHWRHSWGFGDLTSAGSTTVCPAVGTGSIK